jgi:DNA polymerase-3 subunit epsilon
MSWHQERMAAFDLETTGVDPEEARIVEAYVGHVGGGKDPEELSALVNPGVEVPEEASKIHGYTTEFLREHGRPAAEAIEGIAAWVTAAFLRDIPIVGHNVGGYDLTVLDRECLRHGLPGLAERTNGKVGPVIDTRVLSKHIEPFRRKISAEQGPHVLKTCAQVFGVDWSDESAHGARYDAVISARVAWRMGAIAHRPVEEHPRFGIDRNGRSRFSALAIPLEELHVFQVKAKATQDAEFASYLRRLGKQPEGLGGPWPYVPQSVAVTP